MYMNRLCSLLLASLASSSPDQMVQSLDYLTVAPGFKNKTRYTPYVSPGSQISHIATNKDNIKRQCSIYNVLSINDITLDSRQRIDNSDLRVKTLIPQGQLTG